jgi:LacI family transcriptional regulator
MATIFWQHSALRRPHSRSNLKEGHITLEDVAKRARVSVATASRTLAGSKVNKKNSEKVQKAAAELGYVMNEAARSLRNVKTMTVGLVFHELVGAFGIELLSSISSRFDAYGYCVFVATAQGENERYDKLVHRFLERRVDALLCVHGAGAGAALDRFISARIPVAALITKRDGYERLPLFAPSAKTAVAACVESLQKQGHEQVLILRPSRRPFALEEFIHGAKNAGITVRIEAQADGPFDATRVLELCRSGERSPTAVVATQAEAAQILATADRMNIAVPQSLSLVAVRDRTPTMMATRIPLSIIYLDPQKLGIAAADSILAQLSGGAPPKTTVSVEMGTWLEHDTTGVANIATRTRKAHRK